MPLSIAAVPPSIAAAQALVAALIGYGVRRFVLSPGSRSAPLAYALAAAEQRGDIELHVRVDERGAAYFALGIAKLLGQPVAVACTSGTAVANLLPAVVEADLARVPLILLTADRPAELRGKLASQTIDQVGIFGGAVRGSRDVPAPSISYDDDGARSVGGANDDVDAEPANLARWAVQLATNPAKPGPVQLNLQYREPLAPDAAHAFVGGFEAKPQGAYIRTRVSRRAINPVLPGDAARTVVIAGDGAGPLARRVAEAQGWPLLAEPSSGALGGPNAISAYRYLLPMLASNPDTRPEQAIVFGRPTLNRAVNAFLATDGLAVTVVAPGDPPWPDAWRNTARFGPKLNNNWFEANPTSSSFLEKWRMAGQIGATELEQIATQPSAVLADDPAGPYLVARELLAATRPGEPLVVAASSVIRDLDLFTSGWRGDYQPQIITNRGAAGIDGTIATALGVATAARPRTRLYIGDLAFLHDGGSLLLTKGERRPQLQIILANDDGGSIFTSLEHGKWARAAGDQEARQLLERLFTTPQNADFEALCRGYGVACRKAGDLGTLRAALNQPGLGVEVVNIELDGRSRGVVADRFVERLRSALLDANLTPV